MPPEPTSHDSVTKKRPRLTMFSGSATWGKAPTRKQMSATMSRIVASDMMPSLLDRPGVGGDLGCEQRLASGHAGRRTQDGGAATDLAQRQRGQRLRADDLDLLA